MQKSFSSVLQEDETRVQVMFQKTVYLGKERRCSVSLWIKFLLKFKNSWKLQVFYIYTVVIM